MTQQTTARSPVIFFDVKVLLPLTCAQFLLNWSEFLELCHARIGLPRAVLYDFNVQQIFMGTVYLLLPTNSVQELTVNNKANADICKVKYDIVQWRMIFVCGDKLVDISTVVVAVRSVQQAAAAVQRSIYLDTGPETADSSAGGRSTQR